MRTLGCVCFLLGERTATATSVDSLLRIETEWVNSFQQRHEPRVVPLDDVAPGEKPGKQENAKNAKKKADAFLDRALLHWNGGS